MSILTVFDSLGIGKVRGLWTFMTGGIAGIAKLICEAFTKLLRKADIGELKFYSELAEKIAKFVQYGIDLFVTNEKVRAAGNSTANAIATLASHLKDGKYDSKELDIDIDNIEFCIDAWKKVIKKEKANG